MLKGTNDFRQGTHHALTVKIDWQPFGCNTFANQHSDDAAGEPILLKKNPPTFVSGLSTYH